MNDVYQGISVSNYTTNKRGRSETPVHLQSLEQKMMFNKEWLAFLHNIKNKRHLFTLFLTYSVVNQCGLYWLTTKMKHSKFQVVPQVFDCNQEEVNNRMIFHALQ